MLNLDVARGLSFETASSTDELDDALYKRWGGKEVKYEDVKFYNNLRDEEEIVLIP